MKRGHEVVKTGGVASRVAATAQLATHHGRAWAFPDSLIHIYDGLHESDKSEVGFQKR